MSGGGNGNFSNGQFGGMPLGNGGQGSVPARPQVPGQGGFGQKPPMMGNRPMYQNPFNGQMPQGATAGQGMAPMPQSTASPYGGPDSRPMVSPPPFQPLPPGVSMGFSPAGQAGTQMPQMGLGASPPRQPPMQVPGAQDGNYGSDFLMRAMRGH